MCLTNADKCVFSWWSSYFFYQDALSAELNNLGMNYEKELLEKPPTSNEQKNQSSHNFVDRDQFLR